LHCELRVVSLFSRRQVVELGEAGVDVAHVVSALTVRPTRLDFVHRPHLVDVLGKLVSDALDVARQSDLDGFGINKKSEF